MDSTTDELFFFSTEGFSPEFPVKGHFLKSLRNKKNRETGLFECEHKIWRYDDIKYLVLVPKHFGIGLNDTDNESDPIFVYVLDGTEYVNKNEIGLSPGHKIIMDWGGLTGSLDKAREWQFGANEL